MKVTLKDVLMDFRKRKKSIMAFNLQNIYQIEAAKLTSERLQLPVIIQFSERYLRYLDDKYGRDFIVQKFSSDYTYFHLDHCIDIDFIKSCIDSGFDAVMYDGSAFDIQTNIDNTFLLKDYASARNCLLEGELGKVSGVEDGFGDEGSSYAEIKEVIRYVTETNVDLMALGIGNAHGFYDNLEGLNLEILREASEKLHPHQLYVLHGGTGLPDDIIKKAIGYGVVKINLSTQLKKKYMEILHEYSTNNELYNEIAFYDSTVLKLSNLLESYVVKYTK